MTRQSELVECSAFEFEFYFHHPTSVGYAKLGVSPPQKLGEPSNNLLTSLILSDNTENPILPSRQCDEI